MREADRTAILPAHIEETVQAIAKLHAEHHKRATPFQKFTQGLTDRAGRLSFIVWLLVKNRILRALCSIHTLRVVYKFRLQGAVCVKIRSGDKIYSLSSAATRAP